MSAQTARRTILDSIYTLRRRRSVLPLSELTNRFPEPFQPVHKSKSLIQGQRIKAGTCNNGNLSIGRTPGVTCALTRPSLLHGPNSNSFGIRKNYTATNDGYTNFSQDDLNSYIEKQSSNNLNTDTHESDLVVVLDLDECLIHSQFLNSGPEVYRQDEERPQSHAFNSNEEADSVIPSACESFRISLPDGDLVHVNKRPHLDTFLKEITSKYETHIFTAAMEVYAAPLLDQLDPKNEMFKGRYYREDCTFDPSLGVYVKDLKRALRNRSNDNLNEGRVVLVDNNPMSFLANPLNGILVCNFYDDPKDDTLRAVTDLLLQLDKEEDVRPFLNDKFKLKDALEEAVSAPANSTWN